MTPELGHFALILAFVATLMQGVLPLIGAQRSQAQWIALARPAAQTHFLLLAFSFACLAQSFLANDFSVAYVAQNSNTQLPAIYRFAAVWGGHEGSLLLWVLMLSGWGAAASGPSRQLPEAMVARGLAAAGRVRRRLQLHRHGEDGDLRALRHRFEWHRGGVAGDRRRADPSPSGHVGVGGPVR